MELRRQDEPPPHVPNMAIRRIKAGQRVQFVLLGNPWGCWTHWAGDHSEPCLIPKAQCPGCKRQCPTRWRCYVHVWNLARQTDEFLELTGLARQMLDDALPTGEAYRGQRIEVERGKGDKARLRLIVLPAVAVNGRLPESKDPFKTLCKLWGFPQLQDAKPNATEVSPGLSA